MTELQIGIAKAIAMARIGKIIPRIPDPLASPVKAALLERLLPSLHFVALVGMLDEALIDFLDSNQVAWPPKTRPDLFNRIVVASNHVPRLNAKALQQIRKTRNSIAHSTDSIPQGFLSWSDLNETIGTLLESFVTLGVFLSAPSIEAYFEREPTLYLDELGPSGERVKQKYTVGALINGEHFVDFTWEVLYPPMGSQLADDA